jgi:hypothetical protein
MIHAPVATAKAHVAMLHEMTMQRHHPKPEKAFLGNDEFLVCHFLVKC